MFLESSDGVITLDDNSFQKYALAQYRNYQSIVMFTAARKKCKTCE